MSIFWLNHQPIRKSLKCYCSQHNCHITFNVRKILHLTNQSEWTVLNWRITFFQLNVQWVFSTSKCSDSIAASFKSHDVTWEMLVLCTKLLPHAIWPCTRCTPINHCIFGNWHKSKLNKMHYIEILVAERPKNLHSPVRYSYFKLNIFNTTLFLCNCQKKQKKKHLWPNANNRNYYRINLPINEFNLIEFVKTKNRYAKLIDNDNLID